ncbi:hypothetical protein UT300016_05190 [Clostridium senegalense]
MLNSKLFGACLTILGIQVFEWIILKVKLEPYIDIQIQSLTYIWKNPYLLTNQHFFKLIVCINL